MELQVSQATAAATDCLCGDQSHALARGEFWKSRAHEIIDVIRVIEGRVWLTAEGCEEDFVLQAGDELMTSDLKSILIEGLERSVIAIA